MGVHPRPGKNKNQFFSHSVAIAKSDNHLSDENLWTEFRQGSEISFSRIYHKYYPKIYNYARQFTPELELIEDLIQDMFVELWNKRSTIGETDNILFYLLKVIRRKIAGYSKKRQLLNLLLRKENFKVFLIEESIETSIVADQQQLALKSKIQNALLGLNDKQREILFLKYYENLSFYEISQITNQSIDNVYKTMARSLAYLKKIVNKNNLVVFGISLTLELDINL